MNVIIINYNSGNSTYFYNSFFKVALEKKINLLISNKPNEVKKADGCATG